MPFAQMENVFIEYVHYKSSCFHLTFYDNFPLVTLTHINPTPHQLSKCYLTSQYQALEICYFAIYLYGVGPIYQLQICKT